MIKLKQDNNGFSAIEFVMLIAIITLIGVVGWLVHKNHHKAVAVVKITRTVTKPAAKTTTPDTAQPTVYLNITQWGVRAPYISSDTLSYIISSDNPNLAIVISKNMSSNYGCTGANNLPSGAGGIYRALADSTDTDLNSTTSETYAQAAQQDTTDYKQIGIYVYEFSHDQAACQSNTTDAGSTAQGQAETFTNSLIPKLEAIPST